MQSEVPHPLAICSRPDVKQRPTPCFWGLRRGRSRPYLGEIRERLWKGSKTRGGGVCVCVCVYFVFCFGVMPYCLEDLSSLTRD